MVPFNTLWLPSDGASLDTYFFVLIFTIVMKFTSFERFIFGLQYQQIGLESVLVLHHKLG